LLVAVRRRDLVERHRHARHPGAERHQRGRQCRQRRRTDGQIQRAAFAVPHLSDLFLRFSRFLQDQYGALVQRLAIGRQFDAPGAAAHQFCAHALFQFAQAARGRGLGDEQGARRGADAAVVGDQDKGA